MPGLHEIIMTIAVMRAEVLVVKIFGGLAWGGRRQDPLSANAKKFMRMISACFQYALKLSIFGYSLEVIFHLFAFYLNYTFDIIELCVYPF